MSNTQHTPPSAGASAPASDPGTSAGPCDDSGVQALVGQAFDDAMAQRARVSSRALRLRVVRPGQMVTMDFDAARLTIELDEAGRVKAARCG